ncbi:MAG: hypothetical protein IJB02_05370 [Oscillospiraceae bacterium]|nr:hypothetical protein [Oscillospiraceae bacterium]
MITVATLVSAFDLETNFSQKISVENIHEYLSFMYRPYMQLGVFSFCEFRGTKSPIIGQTNWKELTESCQTLYNLQVNRIHILEQACSPLLSVLDLCNTQAGKELLDILSGQLSTNSIYYNTISNSSRIDETTLSQIAENPQKYILAEINLHH